MGMVYKCKICETIVKSALDAFMHMKNYHGITTLDKLKAYFELKKTISEMKQEANQEAKQVQEQKQDENKKQEQKQNENKIVIKKVLKLKQKTLLHYLNTTG
jgi:predicted nuclease with TOPRIM domain